MLDPDGDYDSDGVLNKDDNCYYVYNPLQTDTDEDGKGDVCNPSPFGYRGDGLCIGDENCSTYPEDCGECPVESYCGDNVMTENLMEYYVIIQLHLVLIAVLNVS